MARNIVICCDGTGNEVGAGALTNVARLYRCLDKSDPEEQAVFYHPGVGTLGAPGFQNRVSRFCARTAGLAFGYGLWENITSAYRFLMDHYDEGDRVYLFGFSRGAYTVRALAGVVHMCGLLRRGNQNLIDYAIKLHSTRRRRQPDWIGAARFRKYFSRECEIHFMGVWDTVKSVGLFRRSLILPYTADLPNVLHGRHAVSICEKRSKYRTNLWSPVNGDAFEEAWFLGVHSDVGGGYEDTSLSDIALTWILDAAEAHGLVCTEHADEIDPGDPMGTIHNPLLPLWWLLGWRRRRIPRDVEGPPLMHRSVLVRRDADPEFERTFGRFIPRDAVYVPPDEDETDEG